MTRAVMNANNARLEAMCSDVMIVIGNDDLVVEVGTEFRRKADCMDWEELSDEQLRQQEECAKDAWAAEETAVGSSGSECEDSDAPWVWDDHG